MTAPYPKRFAAELIGTFFFLFLAFSGVAVSVDLPDAISAMGVAAGFGAGLALAIFTLGHISGGHFNPAVTFGLATARRFPWSEVAGYWVAQIIGAVAAAALAVSVYSDNVQNALVNVPGTTDWRALILEAVAVMLFLMLIQAVATDKAPWSGLFAPLSIGLFIFTAGMVIGPFSGFSFNPARSIAPAILAADGSSLWIYLVGPLVGGLAGGLLYSWARVKPGEGEVEELSGD